MVLWIIGFGLGLALVISIPLSLKWELDKKMTIPAAIFTGILSGAIVNVMVVFWNLSFYSILVFEILLFGMISSLLLFWRFYRDPERIVPETENVVLSPADGEIIYIKKIEHGRIPFSEKKGSSFSLIDFIQADVLPQGGYLIGIAMTYLDVHVNRAPISGQISFLKHIKGKFISLKMKEAVVQNERNLIIIENDNFKLGIVQIASRLVRNIISYIQTGQEVQIGARIGVIRFGSQVDLIIPDVPTLSIEITPGKKVKAGMTILARFVQK